jgi:L-proline dehydrogenase / delta-1-pyrroline-5-carboxylate dehydrogenase
VLTGLGLTVEVKSEDRFDRKVRGRVRHLGERDLLTAVGGSIDVSVHAGPTLYPGRLALLPYVHEQAVSVTNHRFGHPTPLTDDLRI